MANYMIMRCSRKPIGSEYFDTIEEAREAIKERSSRKTKSKSNWVLFEKGNRAWIGIEEYFNGEKVRIKL